MFSVCQPSRSRSNTGSPRNPCSLPELTAQWQPQYCRLRYLQLAFLYIDLCCLLLQVNMRILSLKSLLIKLWKQGCGWYFFLLVSHGSQNRTGDCRGVQQRHRTASGQSGRSLGQGNRSSAFGLRSATDLQCHMRPVPFCFQTSADPSKTMLIVLKLPSISRTQRVCSVTDMQMSVCYFMWKLLGPFKETIPATLLPPFLPHLPNRRLGRTFREHWTQGLHSADKS